MCGARSSCWNSTHLSQVKPICASSRGAICGTSAVRPKNLQRCQPPAYFLLAVSRDGTWLAGSAPWAGSPSGALKPEPFNPSARSLRAN